MWVLSLLLGVVVVLLITAATGYFVAQEFAYMTVDRNRLKAREAEGDVSASRALAVTRRTSFMLSGAQLGITVTALLVGYVAEPLIGEALGVALGGVGVPTGVGIGIGTAFALIFSTFVQMLFGELFPKNLSIAKPEPVARWLARSTTIYLAAFGWLIAIFDAASNALLKLAGMEPVHDVESSASRADLAHIVADSRETGDLPAELALLIDRIVDFPDEDVEHAMVPRARLGTVRADDSLDELWTTMASGHSRYPVLGSDQGIEEIVGVVHLQDVLGVTDRSGRDVASVMREPVLVPAVMSLPDALTELTARKEQLACVLDEHGGLTGVITLEDLAEELVGEIDDEHDPDLAPGLDSLDHEEGEEPATEWTLPGSLPYDELERAVGRDLPELESETLGGLLVEVNGAFAEVGDVVEVDLVPAGEDLLDSDAPPDRLRLEVLELERHVPGLVHVTLVDADDVEPDTADERSETTDDGDLPTVDTTDRQEERA
ncbi:hemolysin family protein [uncultured Nocardioides sp.]|uniref:hemolysin family protein n=1 Tax=uncultured Nocardioides sp. TaxID=198441 RepID=UPI0026357921|nr:hemolysin family protein [uncultured Nocardioides sp.]